MVTLRSYRKQEFRIRYIRRISTYFSKLLLNNENKKKQNKTKGINFNTLHAPVRLPPPVGLSIFFVLYFG